MEDQSNLATEKSSEEAVHMEVLKTAYDVYLDRNEIYGSLWRKSGSQKNLVMMKHKMDRIKHIISYNQNDPEFEDDVLDLINYSVFLLRCVQEERERSQSEPRVRFPKIWFCQNCQQISMKTPPREEHSGIRDHQHDWVLFPGSGQEVKAKA